MFKQSQKNMVYSQQENEAKWNT